MRSFALFIAMVGLTGCGSALCKAGSVDCELEPDNLTDVDDTDDPADTNTPVDTEDPEPDPVFYESDAITLKTRNPVAWSPLSYSQQVIDTSIGGSDVKVTLGATVAGSTKVEVSVDSHLDEVERGEWEQHFTGLKDGGKIDATMSLTFPITIKVGSTTMDVSGLLNMPSFNQVVPTHVFETLALTQDGQSTSFSSSAYTYTWSSGERDPEDYIGDPGYYLPFFDLTLDVEIIYGAEFTMKYYELLEDGSSASIERQHLGADRQEVTFYVGDVGEENETVAFEGTGAGSLKNTLTVRPTMYITMWYGWCQAWCETTFPVTRDWDIGDAGAWELKLDKDPIIHTQE